MPPIPPLKYGMMKTPEFWLAIVASSLNSLLLSKTIAPDSIWHTLILLALAVLSAIGVKITADARNAPCVAQNQVIQNQDATIQVLQNAAATQAKAVDAALLASGQQPFPTTVVNVTTPETK